MKERNLDISNRGNILHRTTAALAAAGILIAGCSSNQEGANKGVVDAGATPTEIDNSNTSEPTTTNPNKKSAKSEIGTALTEERAITPEENEAYKATAIGLATSITSLYNQGIGNGNFIHINEQNGRQYLNVINDANDGSGHYVLVAGLPVGSMDPSGVNSIYVAKVEGKVDGNETVGTSNDNSVGRQSSLFSFSMEISADNGENWGIRTEVDSTVDVAGAVGPNSTWPNVDYAKLVITQAADGAPVG